MEAHRTLTARLRTFYPLTDAAIEVLAKAQVQLAQIERGDFVARQGEHAERTCLLLEGVLASTSFRSEGQRQISGFHLSGDIPDLRSVLLEILDVGLQAVTRCRVAYIPHSVIRDLCRREPDLAAAFWKMTLVDGSIHREWISALGSLDARQRTAHLLCEFFYRLRAIGEATREECPFPLSQSDMADALGISAVHVNRVLQDMRADCLIELKKKTLRILDWAKLRDAARFNPMYLHLGEIARPAIAEAAGTGSGS